MAGFGIGDAGRVAQAHVSQTRPLPVCLLTLETMLFFGLKASPLQLIRGNVGYSASYLRNQQQGSKLASSR
jgi:hypothetical protein